MHARDMIGMGGLKSEHCGMLGTYGRDTRNNNRERLLAFASNHDPALGNTSFGAPNNDTSHTFNGVGNRKRFYYIQTRQRDRNLVWNVFCSPCRTRSQTSHAFGTKPTVKEGTATLRSMAYSKAGGPDENPGLV